jgi:Rrf2 family cysteine metabolism transcriptional repressor
MIRLSTKGRYGTRSMLELALRRGSGPVLIKQVAAAQEIPVKYLEHVLTLLRVAGLVKAYRGPRGGYVLARDPAEITLNQMLTALEGPISLVHCQEMPEECARSKTCVTQDIWTDISTRMTDFMDGITLKDIVGMHHKKVKAAGITEEVPAEA